MGIRCVGEREMRVVVTVILVRVARAGHVD